MSVPRSCPLCDSASHDVNVDYVVCPSCGLIFVRELPTREAMDDCYGGGLVRRVRRRLLAPFRRMWTHRNLAWCRQRANRILGLIESEFEGKGAVRHLDVGCNKGYLLEAALKKGWEPWGIEIAADMVAPFLNSYPEVRPRVVCGKFPEVASELPAGTFDLITAIDVIEHFTELLPGLEALGGLLKPGGLLMVRTPDTTSVAARRDGAAWGALKAVEHLNLVEPKLLDSIRTRLGFSGFGLLDDVVDDPESNLMAVLIK